MRHFSKLLCIVLALVVALSAASCSLTKQYSYKTDDVEFPIGVYIYYLQSAYNEAQTYAQKSDKYDSEAGTYDGQKSFLKLEITDDDDVTAVAETWIKNKADEYMREACAVYYEYKKLGATYDEATAEYYTNYYQQYWEQISETYEGYGISFESFLQAGITIPLMRSAAFEKEYAVDGPMAVSDDEVLTYFNDNYTSYHYFSANLYTSETQTVTDENGSETEDTVNTSMSDEQIALYETKLGAYAANVAAGKATFEKALEVYNKAFGDEATATESVAVIEEDTEDEILQTLLTMKEGEAVTKITGEGDSRKIYLIYKEPITAQAEYVKDSDHRSEIVSKMKTEDFNELLKALGTTMTIDVSSACGSYNPSMFESK
jgi:hypothetical protein